MNESQKFDYIIEMLDELSLSNPTFSDTIKDIKNQINSLRVSKTINDFSEVTIPLAFERKCFTMSNPRIVEINHSVNEYSRGYTVECIITVDSAQLVDSEF